MVTETFLSCSLASLEIDQEVCPKKMVCPTVINYTLYFISHNKYFKIILLYNQMIFEIFIN